MEIGNKGQTYKPALLRDLQVEQLRKQELVNRSLVIGPGEIIE